MDDWQGSGKGYIYNYSIAEAQIGTIEKSKANDTVLLEVVNSIGIERCPIRHSDIVCSTGLSVNTIVFGILSAGIPTSAAGSMDCCKVEAP